MFLRNFDFFGFKLIFFDIFKMFECIDIKKILLFYYIFLKK